MRQHINTDNWEYLIFWVNREVGGGTGGREGGIGAEWRRWSRVRIATTQLNATRGHWQPAFAGVCCNRYALAKAGSTLRSSRAVPHPSTNRALRRLTSEVRRDPVHSTRYGRRRSYMQRCTLLGKSTILRDACRAGSTYTAAPKWSSTHDLKQFGWETHVSLLEVSELVDAAFRSPATDYDSVTASDPMQRWAAPVCPVPIFSAPL